MRQTGGGQCVQCDSTNVPLVSLYVIVSIAFVIAFHRLSQNERGSADTSVFFYFGTFLLFPLIATAIHICVTSLFCVVPTVQMCLLFVGQEGWLAWLSVFNMNIVSSGTSSCVTPITPMQTLLLGMLVPVIICAELLTMFLIHGGYHPPSTSQVSSLICACVDSFGMVTQS
jgi:hypothetical protein